MSTSTKHLIVIHGPTAVGKTNTAIKLAKDFQAEIFSADSRQIYKELQIGVAKPDEHELKEVVHHFINHISIQEYYSAGLYEKELMQSLDDYFEKNDVAILVGGTGLYIKAALEGFDELPEIPASLKNLYQAKYESQGIEFLQFCLKQLDPEAYEQIDHKNPYRLIRAICLIEVSNKKLAEIRVGETVERPFKAHQIKLLKDREVLYQNINQRVDQMMKMGLVEEAKSFYAQKDLQALQTVGYKEVFDFLNGTIDKDQMVELIKQHSRRYAKRQLTWLRKVEAPIFHPKDYEQLFQYLQKEINQTTDG